ncbi:MAG: TIGR02300 family protein, partial [Leptospiraceae bacterium]|nr:TIGR02300 family protein [Leptospiraceae bacterium]
PIVKKKPTASPSSKKKSKSSGKTTSKGSGLGKKHTCYNCDTKFYDLGHLPPTCPKCGVDQTQKPVVKTRKVTPKVTEFDVVDEDLGINEQSEEIVEDADLEMEEGETELIEEDEGH